MSRLMLAFVCLALAALPARADETTINVGGVSINFGTVPGWCLYPPDLRNTTFDMLKSLRTNQVYLAVIGDCDQMSASRGGGARVRDFGTLIVDKQNLYVNADIGREEIISALETDLPNLDLATKWEVLRTAIEKKLREPKVNSLNIFGVIAKDRWSAYPAGIGQFRTDVKPFALLSVTSVTVVKRRLLSITIYTDYTGRQSVVAALDHAQRHVARLVELNP